MGPLRVFAPPREPRSAEMEFSPTAGLTRSREGREEKNWFFARSPTSDLCPLFSVLRLLSPVSRLTAGWRSASNWGSRRASVHCCFACDVQAAATPVRSGRSCHNSPHDPVGPFPPDAVRRALGIGERFLEVGHADYQLAD